MTTASVIADIVKRTTRASGVPERLEDADVADRVAALLLPVEVERAA